MGFLGTPAGIPADVNLVLQIAILCVLILSRSHAKKKIYAKHGRYMAIAVALNATALVVVMLPAFLSGLNFIETNPTNLLSIIEIIHAVLGTTSLILGVYLVAKWRFSKSFVECFKNKDLMNPTTVIWATTAVIGILLYIELYVTAL
jgi:uncharacterized membrane protein YozB (DUF420 family)